MLLEVDQPRQPLIDEALLLAAEGDDEDVVLLGEIAGQLVLLAVESATGQRAQRLRLRGGERAPETSKSAIADTVERERQERVGDPEQAFQREVGVVGDACARGGRLERDPVPRDHGGVLAEEGDRMRRVVLDDPIGELVLAAEELGHQPELGSLAHRLTVQTLRLDHARIPFPGCREIAEVGKYVLAGLLDVDRCSVVGHQDSPSGIEVDAVGTDASCQPLSRTHSARSRSRSCRVSRVHRSRCVGRGRRSCQNRPELRPGSAAAPSQTIVSAPCAGVLSSGRVTL